MKHAHIEILDSDRIRLLHAIEEAVKINYYMAGGTGLSLQRGYRVSVDFDFFTQEMFNAYELAELLKSLADHADVISVSEGTCNLHLDGVQVSFSHYPYPLLEKPEHLQKFKNIQIASMEDITAMKLVAIGQRGARKDFYDLYEIIRDMGYTVDELMDFVLKKYGSDRDLAYIGMGMSYFEDAESQILGKCYRTENWDKIKKYFVRLSDKFMHSLLYGQKK